jgi:hypothetical protein
MTRVATVALVMLLLLAHAAPAAGEKDAHKKKLAGTWKRSLGENSITFTFKGNTLHALVKTTEQTLHVDADYGISKDGVLFGRISKANKEGDDGGPSEGDLFSFRFRIEGNTLTLSDLKTPQENDEAKELLQGEYFKQKEKAK